MPQVHAATDTDLPGLRALLPDRDRLDRRTRQARSGAETLLVVTDRAAAATVDGAPGWALGLLSIRWRDGCDRPHPWLYGGYVHPGLRGRGLGTALWREAERTCRDRGHRALTLDVEPANLGALRLYERLGYTIVRPHRHRWTDRDPATGAVRGTGVTDTWLMRKSLRPLPG